jgi:hypothetical protein
MSHRTQRTSRYIFEMLAQLSENFIFIYLGLSLFTAEHLVYKPMFILVTAVRCDLHAHWMKTDSKERYSLLSASLDIVPFSQFQKSSTFISKLEDNVPMNYRIHIK